MNQLTFDYAVSFNKSGFEGAKFSEIFNLISRTSLDGTNGIHLLVERTDYLILMINMDGMLDVDDVDEIVAKRKLTPTSYFFQKDDGLYRPVYDYNKLEAVSQGKQILRHI